jgi:hypothetical protein
MTTPVSCTEVYIQECIDKEGSEHENDDDDEDEDIDDRALVAQTMKNAEGGAIMSGQFITNIHACLNRHEEDIRPVKSEMFGKEMTDSSGSVSRGMVWGRRYRLPDTLEVHFRDVTVASRNGMVQCFTSSFHHSQGRKTIKQSWSIQ